MTEAHFAAFQMLSGDNHPIHYDIEYCKARGLRGMLAHGFQVLCFSAAGAGSFPHMIGDALIGFIEQSSKFLKGVYVGDTLYPALAITALIPQRTTGIVVMAATIHNQNERTGADRRTQVSAAKITGQPSGGISRKRRRKSCPSFPESARFLNC